MWFTAEISPDEMLGLHRHQRRRIHCRPDGDIDWLLRPEYAVSLLNGLSFEAFIADIDALVMGRHTYEKSAPFPNGPMENCRWWYCRRNPHRTAQSLSAG